MAVPCITLLNKVRHSNDDRYLSYHSIMLNIKHPSLHIASILSTILFFSRHFYPSKYWYNVIDSLRSSSCCDSYSYTYVCVIYQWIHWGVFSSLRTRMTPMFGVGRKWRCGVDKNGLLYWSSACSYLPKKGSVKAAAFVSALNTDSFVRSKRVSKARRRKLYIIIANLGFCFRWPNAY